MKKNMNTNEEIMNLYDTALAKEGLADISPFIRSKFRHACNRVMLDNQDNDFSQHVHAARITLRILIAIPNTVI